MRCLPLLLIAGSLVSSSFAEVAKWEKKSVEDHQHDKLLKEINRAKDAIHLITWQGMSSMLPKAAVLSLPKNLENRFGTVMAEKFVSFSEFHNVNKNWITTLPITAQQLKGDGKLDLVKLEQLKKNGTIVISTYNGEPVGLSKEIMAKITSPAE